MLVVFLDYIYLICATVISIRKYFREKHKLERGRYLAQIFYILFYTVSGWVMGYFLNIPTIELCMMPVVLKLFIDLQDSRIYTDALTKLDNRRRISEYIDKELLTCSVEKPLTLIMIDIDFFKSVNDVLGHDVGDEVLVSFSKALSNLTSSKYARAARWGGDEFIAVLHSHQDAEEFVEAMQETLQINNEQKTLPFRISVSYGIADHDTTIRQTPDQVRDMADERMDKNKLKNHRER
jgi:diguanylate cyclase (GGDEF)-like protein